MTPDELAEWIPVVPWLVALVLLIIAVALFVKFVWPVLKRFADLVDDLLGEDARAGVPARPGLMERMQSVESEQKRQGDEQQRQSEVLALVKHEVLPNTGTSLNDAVRRTEAHARATDAKVEEALAWQRKHEAKSDAIVARVDKIEENRHE